MPNFLPVLLFSLSFEPKLHLFPLFHFHLNHHSMADNPILHMFYRDQNCLKLSKINEDYTVKIHRPMTYLPSKMYMVVFHFCNLCSQIQKKYQIQQLQYFSYSKLIKISYNKPFWTDTIIHKKQPRTLKKFFLR